MRKNVFAVAATLMVFAGATSADARPSRDDSWNPFIQHSSSVTGDVRANQPRAKRQRAASRQRGQKVRYATRAREARQARRHYASTAESSNSGGYRHSVGGRPRA